MHNSVAVAERAALHILAAQAHMVACARPTQWVISTCNITTANAKCLGVFSWYAGAQPHSKVKWQRNMQGRHAHNRLIGRHQHPGDRGAHPR